MQSVNYCRNAWSYSVKIEKGCERVGCPKPFVRKKCGNKYHPECAVLVNKETTAKLWKLKKGIKHSKERHVDITSPEFVNSYYR
jgi:hypothetical protein